MQNYKLNVRIIKYHLFKITSRMQFNLGANRKCLLSCLKESDFNLTTSISTIVSIYSIFLPPPTEPQPTVVNDLNHPLESNDPISCGDGLKMINTLSTVVFIHAAIADDTFRKIIKFFTLLQQTTNLYMIYLKRLVAFNCSSLSPVTRVIKYRLFKIN